MIEAETMNKNILLLLFFFKFLFMAKLALDKYSWCWQGSMNVAQLLANATLFLQYTVLHVLELRTTSLDAFPRGLHVHQG